MPKIALKRSERFVRVSIDGKLVDGLQIDHKVISEASKARLLNEAYLTKLFDNARAKLLDSGEVNDRAVVEAIISALRVELDLPAVAPARGSSSVRR